MSEKGHTSRRAALKGGLVVGVGAVSTLAGSMWARAQEKIAQAMVQYQNTPKDGAKCSLCVNWEAPNACKIVAGTINPDGWCVAYAPKGA